MKYKVLDQIYNTKKEAFEASNIIDLENRKYMFEPEKRKDSTIYGIEEKATQQKCRDIIEKMALYLSENPDKHPNTAWEVVRQASNLTELEMKEAMLVALLPTTTSNNSRHITDRDIQP